MRTDRAHANACAKTNATRGGSLPVIYTPEEPFIPETGGYADPPKKDESKPRKYLQFLAQPDFRLPSRGAA